MLNGYLLDNKLQKHKDERSKSLTQEKWQSRRKKQRNQFAENYRQRMTTNDAVVMHEYTPLMHQIESISFRKNKSQDTTASSGFIIRGWKSERDRIQDSIKQQEFFTSTPSLISVRDFPKLLRTTYSTTGFNQPGMHFTAKTGLERVFDAVKKNEVLLDEKDRVDTYTNFEKKLPKGWSVGSLKDPLNTTTMRYKVNVLEAARKLRGTLHNKTHFQAVMALVHKQSKTLAPLSNKKQEGVEIEDFSKGCEIVHQDFEAEQKKAMGKRAKSLPKLERLKIDNTSPLKDIKRKNLAYLGALLDQNIENNEEKRDIESIVKSQTNSATNKSKTIKKVRFPALTPSCITGFLTSQRNSKEGKVDTEEIGRKVLRHCKVMRSKSPAIGSTGILRKGEGKLMCGFGMTNRETYYKVFGATYD